MNKNMDWNLYEHLVHEKFRELYPNSKIEYNVSLRGLKSKRSRQIDTLITTTVSNIDYKIVVDAKYFSKKINIKTVESFIGFLSDIDAQKGVLVSGAGFTKSAQSRIDNDDSEIELKILTLEELPNFVGFKAIVIKGPIEFLLDSHPKWLIHSKNPTSDAIAKIHPKKYDLPKAIASKEYIYTTIAIHFDEDFQMFKDYNFDLFLEYLRKSMFKKHPLLNKITFDSFVKVDEEETILLLAEMNKYSEYLAIIDYDEYTVLFGLVTPNKKKEENLEVLGYFVSQVKPLISNNPSIPNLSQLLISSKNMHWKSNK